MACFPCHVLSTLSGRRDYCEEREKCLRHLSAREVSLLMVLMEEPQSRHEGVLMRNELLQCQHTVQQTSWATTSRYTWLGYTKAGIYYTFKFA